MFYTQELDGKSNALIEAGLVRGQFGPSPEPMLTNQTQENSPLSNTSLLLIGTFWQQFTDTTRTPQGSSRCVIVSPQSHEWGAYGREWIDPEITWVAAPRRCRITVAVAEVVVGHVLGITDKMLDECGNPKPIHIGERSDLRNDEPVHDLPYL